MKIECNNCGNQFDGNIRKDILFGWQAECPLCRNETGVPLPAGRFVIAFSDDSDPKKDGENFTDNFPGPRIRTYHAFHTAEEFIAFWEKLTEDPEGMWYWCVDLEGEPDRSGYCCFCSGACDPADLTESFANYPPLAEAARKSPWYDEEN